MKAIATILAAMTIMATAPQTSAVPEAAKNVRSVNVKDFGAKGDGLTDDTAAIQKAVDKSAAFAKAYPRPWGAGFPELVFPEGVYVISKPVVLGSGLTPCGGLEKGRGVNNAFSKGMGFVYARGEGKAVIRQADPDADILYVGMAYRTVIEKLSFEGGRHAINIWTGNQDACLPIIRDCEFSGSSSYAIQTPYIKRLPNGDFTGYCTRSSDGTLTEFDPPEASHFLYHSTYLHIQRCVFKNCANVLFTVADMAMMEDCRIETSPAMKGAAIRTAGMLKLLNIDGVANVKRENGQRWIDLDFGTQSWVVAERLNLRCASQDGLCVIRGNDKFRLSTTHNPDAIVLRDSSFNCDGCPEGAAISLEEIPNIVSVSNCENTGRATLRAVALASPKDAAYFKQILKPGGKPIVPGGLAFMVDGRNRNMDTELPPVMEPYRRTPPPPAFAAMADALTPASKDKMLSAADFVPVKRIDAGRFGLIGNGVADDTAAIQKAFDAAGEEQGLTQLDFPGTVCNISGMIKVPSQVVVRGSGRTVFMAADGAEAGFRSDAPERIAFLNCAFESGSTAFDAKISEGAKAKMLFDNCSFSNTSGPSVKCVSAGKTLESRLANTLRIENCVFFNNMQAAVSDVNAVIDSTWISTYMATFKTGVDLKSRRSWEGVKFKGSLPDDDPTRDIAVIENTGRLFADGICGVPCAQWLRRDLRWIDNLGAILCDFFRFGGEGGGLTALKTFRSDAGMKCEAVIQNSWVHHGAGAWNHPGDMTAQVPQTYLVDAKILPDALLLRDNVGAECSYPPHSYLGESVQTKDINSLGILRERVAMSCNVFPEDMGIKKTTADIKKALRGKGAGTP